MARHGEDLALPLLAELRRNGAITYLEWYEKAYWIHDFVGCLGEKQASACAEHCENCPILGHEHDFRIMALRCQICRKVKWASRADPVRRARLLKEARDLMAQCEDLGRSGLTNHPLHYNKFFSPFVFSLVGI